MSLRRRFIASTLLWIVAGLLFTGSMVSNLFRENITQGFHDEMQIHIEELQALIKLDPNGQPLLLRRLSDPRFIDVGSGFYWEVRRDGFNTLRSPSLGHRDISSMLAKTTKKSWAITKGPTGETLEYGMAVLTKDNGPPLHLSIASDIRVLDKIQQEFNTPLVAELSAFAIIMLVLGAVQIQFSLQPLKRMTAGIADIRGGRATAMTGEFPSEISPLVTDLNAHLAANTEMVRTARIHAGNLAHGLRTPLAILVDEASRLEGLGQTQSADALKRECHRMQRQIDYHLAKARSAALACVPGQSASIRETITPIISAFLRLHAERNIKICCGDFPDYRLACDDVDLGEMISNLLDNACKWADSQVIISWESDRRIALILIDDDGPGLTPELREQVFAVGAKMDDGKAGTGLGLAIVQDLVKLYGGNIVLSSSPLGGLRAELYLPISQLA